MVEVGGKEGGRGQGEQGRGERRRAWDRGELINDGNKARTQPQFS